MQLITHFIPFGNITREIRVLLPKKYYQAKKSYPVIYFHDGQNLFYDHESFIGHSWRVMQTLDKLNIEVIVVALHNSENRLHEMAPFEIIDEFKFKNNRKYFEMYEKYCLDSMQFIKTTYRIKSNPKYTAMIGSSLGACFTQYFGMKYVDKIGNLGIFSSANFIFPNAFQKHIANYKSKNQKFYIQVGGCEKSKGDIFKNQDQLYLDTAINFYNQLLMKKISLKNIKLEIIAKGKHSEKTWAKCLPQCLMFFNQFWNKK